MEKQKEKIMRFSKAVCVVITVVFVIYVVVAAMELTAWVWSGSGLRTETIIINGVETEAPLLFKFGDVRVVLPVMWKVGYDFGALRGFFPEAGLGNFLGSVLTLVTLRFTRKIFTLLRADGSPFRDEVVTALKRLTIALLVTGGVSGAIPFIAAGVAWVLCLIFDYGRALQDESDATL